jgi:hypothetical protein
MDFEHVFEPAPLLVAAATGAVAFSLLQWLMPGNVAISGLWRNALTGAGIGAIVQITVRVTGVS